jgi:four helix bundle protein
MVPSLLNGALHFWITPLRGLLHRKSRCRSFVAAMVPALTKSARPALRDQLERASASIALNLAEGCARRTKRDRHHFFTMAQGSAMECAAAIDILRVTGHLAPADATSAKHKLTRIVQMLVARGQACASPRGSSALGLRRSR